MEICVDALNENSYESLQIEIASLYDSFIYVTHYVFVTQKAFHQDKFAMETLISCCYDITHLFLVFYFWCRVSTILPIYDHIKKKIFI